jgi:hypothetical protein
MPGQCKEAGHDADLLVRHGLARIGKCDGPFELLKMVASVDA